MKITAATSAAALALFCAAAFAQEATEEAHMQMPMEGWLQPFAETGTIRIRTQDADEDLRDTPVWCVVLHGALWVRTNDSRWLANIRRGSAIEVRAGGDDADAVAVRAEEISDAKTQEEVEAAFLDKYGFLQRLFSWFRFRAPVVLRLQRAH